MDAPPQDMDVDAVDAHAVSKALRALDAKELLAVALDAAKRDAAPLAAALAARERKRPPKRRRKAQKPMDLAKYEARDVALWLAYDGRAYRGFAAQEKAAVDIDTVERQLFLALEKTCLIANRDECAYSRCGRTDKGVSAACQVVGLKLRSVARRGTKFEQMTPPHELLEDTERIDAETGAKVPGTQKLELDYVGMLNRVLPSDVRAVAWAPVVENFSARFSCALRTYRYWLNTENAHGRPRDLGAMRRAAAKFVGDHDFRNFCKMDVVHVNNFRREIYAASIEAAGPGLLRFEVHGQAFLWHMVRCLVAIIELVGDGLETPEVIDELLDVAKRPRRPQYVLAYEAPLVLHECAFDTVRPAPTPESMLHLHEHLTKERHVARVSLARTENLLGKLDNLVVAGAPWAAARPTLLAAADQKARTAYRPLAIRECGKSYEEAVRAARENPTKRSKIEECESKREVSRAGFHQEKRGCG